MKTLILSDIPLGCRHTNLALLMDVLDRQSFDRLILNGDTIHNLNFRKMAPRHWAVVDRKHQPWESLSETQGRGSNRLSLDALLL